MNNNPLVSVLMNCHNCDKYLHDAIDSVYAQSYSNWEIIFVDNASTDFMSNKMILKYDDRIKLIRIKKKISLYGARNIGMENVNGKYVAFLDTDDIWMPTKLYDQIKAINQEKVQFSCGSYYILKDNDEIAVETKNGIIAFDDQIENYSINLQTMVMESDLLKKNAFDDKLNILGDYDCFLRIMKGGVVGVSLSKKLAYYRVHNESLSRSSIFEWKKELTVLAKKDFIQDPFDYERIVRRHRIVFFTMLMNEGRYKEARDMIRVFAVPRIDLFLKYVLSVFPYIYNIAIKVKIRPKWLKG